jgi:hypothetical protein
LGHLTLIPAFAGFSALADSAIQTTIEKEHRRYSYQSSTPSEATIPRSGFSMRLAIQPPSGRNGAAQQHGCGNCVGRRANGRLKYLRVDLTWRKQILSLRSIARRAGRCAAQALASC